MTRKQTIYPNIIRGGAAIPLGDNIYLLKGKKHSQGGIDIGKDLEAEGDEVVKMNPKSIKVVTAQKIMGGKSPAELVVNASSTGEQEEVFNDVFKYQEKFKDRNDLNDDGTKKVESNKKYKAQIGTNKKLKDLAYKIITQDSVHDDAKAGIVDIIKGLSVKTPPKDDNKEMFIYGNVAGLPPTDTTKGKNFDEYIKINYPKRTIKQYEGIINPFNEYIIDEKNKGLIEALAEKNKHIYSILEDEYIHHAIGKNPDVPRSGGVEFMNTPYKDDVHSYPLQFSKNKNGDIIAHAADLYDFNYREYLKRLQFVRAAQAAALTAVGNPYILRQNDIPVRFISLKGKSNYNPIITYDGYERDMNLTDEERRAVNFNKILDYIGDEQLAEYLDNGYIEPSIITAKQKKLGGMKQFKDRKKAASGGAWASLIGEYGPAAAASTTQLTNAGLMFPVNLGSVIGANVYTKKQLDKIKEATLDYNTETYNAQTKYNKDKYDKLNELLDKYYKEDLADLERHKIVRKDAVYSPVKLKTRININPRLEAIQRQRDENIESIIQNTSSSKDMLNRIRKERLNARDQEVAVQGQKEYTETQLINKDLMQRKATMEKQVDANLRLDELRARDLITYYNNLANLKKGYNQNKLQSTLKNLEDEFNTENLKRTSDFNAESSYRQGRMENRMNLIQGISDSVGQFLSEVNNSAMTAAKLQTMQNAYGNNKVNPQTSFSPVGIQDVNSQYFGNSGQNSVMTREQFDTLYNQILSRGYNLELGKMGGKFKVKRRNK